MKNFVTVCMLCLLLSMWLSHGQDAHQLVGQKIDEYVTTQWRQERFGVIEQLLTRVRNAEIIDTDRREIFVDILEEDLAVYTQDIQTGLAFHWLTTDTSIRSVPLEEILDGWPWKDWIPAISFPSFISVGEASQQWYLRDSLEWMVITNAEWNSARFYPFSILNRHEVVNDVINEVPIAITYCPLCGTAISYNRRIGDQVIEFGVSWLLYESNLLMYDDATESLRSQAFWEAIAWIYTDYELEYYPSQQITFDQFRQLYPQGVVMSNKTGYQRDYTLWSPYLGYEDSEVLYFPVQWRDTSVDPKRRMVVVNDPRWFSAAFDRKDLLKEWFASLRISDQVTLTAYVEDDAIIIIEDGHNELPHFIEMWFSWSARNTWSSLRWNGE
jgi:hypothetical protein